MPSAETVSRLLGLLYNSAADVELWPRFVEALIREVGATSGFVVALGERNSPALYSDFGFDSDFQQAYQGLFQSHDITLDRFLEAGSKGAWIGVRQSLIPDRELDKSLFYNDFMRPRDIYHQAGLNLGRTGNYPHAGLSLLRPRVAGEFGEDTVQMLRLLAPHLTQVFVLHQRMAASTIASEVFDCGLGSAGFALLALDGAGRVQVETSGASRYIAEQGCLSISDGWLRAACPDEDRALQALIYRATRAGARLEDPMNALPPGGAMTLSRYKQGRPLTVVITPFHSESSLLGKSPSAIIFLTDPDARPMPRSLILRQLYRLTPSEAILADWLAQGLSLKDAADRMRITENSVRSLSKNIFRKTGAGGQSALMRLVLALPGGVGKK